MSDAQNHRRYALEVLVARPVDRFEECRDAVARESRHAHALRAISIDGEDDGKARAFRWP